jgi:hypothetical protein
MLTLQLNFYNKTTGLSTELLFLQNVYYFLFVIERSCILLIMISKGIRPLAILSQESEGGRIPLKRQLKGNSSTSIYQSNLGLNRVPHTHPSNKTPLKPPH